MSGGPAAFAATDRPVLASGVRLGFDEVRGVSVLLFPEGLLLLNGTAAQVLEHCDGSATLGQLAAALGGRFRDVSEDEIRTLLEDFRARRLVRAAGRDPVPHG